MTETLDTADEIRRIRDRVDAMEARQQLMMRKDAAEYRKAIVNTFRLSRNKILAPVYLAIDGTRIQSDIVDLLQQNGWGGSPASVSRSVRFLRDEGLIERIKVDKDGVVWAKNKPVERILRLTKALQKEGLANGGAASNRN
jgi:DNA-binding transcriptional ArsR family regulator